MAGSSCARCQGAISCTAGDGCGRARASIKSNGIAVVGGLLVLGGKELVAGHLPPTVASLTNAVEDFLSKLSRHRWQGNGFPQASTPNLSTGTSPSLFLCTYERRLRWQPLLTREINASGGLTVREAKHVSPCQSQAFVGGSAHSGRSTDPLAGRSCIGGSSARSWGILSNYNIGCRLARAVGHFTYTNSQLNFVPWCAVHVHGAASTSTPTLPAACVCRRKHSGHDGSATHRVAGEGRRLSAQQS